MKNLNVRPEPIKLLEENIHRVLFYISLSHIFTVGHDWSDLAAAAAAAAGNRDKSKNKQMEVNQTKKLLHTAKLCKAMILQ